MTGRRVYIIGLWLVSCLAFTIETADAALTTNSWTFMGSGRWEDGTKWTQGAPSTANAANFIANSSPLFGVVVTVDATTAGTIPSVMTVSNLTVSSLAGSHELFLNNTGAAELLILNSLFLRSGGILTITNSVLHVGSASASIAVNGSLVLRSGTILAATGLTEIGRDGAGQWIVLDGTWLSSSEVSVGSLPGSVGTLTMAGGSSTLTSLFQMGVSNGAQGTVWLTGGQLDVSSTFVEIGFDGVGQMTVSNATWQARSVDVAFGTGSQGTLTVAGGTVTFSSSFSITQRTAATGTVWMADGQLTVTNSSTAVGYLGVGQMTVSNGLWRAKDVLVGTGGEGKLTMAGGSNIFSATFEIAGASDSTGEVWMTGGQLIVTNNSTTVGKNGTGRMTVSNGTWRARDVSIGSGVGSRGTLTIAGGVSSVYTSLIIGDTGCAHNGTMLVKGGSLFVTNASHNAVLEVRDGNLLFSSGTLVVDRLVVTNYCSHFIRTGGTLVIGSTNLLAGADADGDGLPNDWEMQNGFDPFDATTGVQDTDGDGLDNYVEYLAGTDPRNAADPFRVTGISKESNNIRVTWEFLTPPGNPYDHCVLEGSKSITGTWNNVSGTMTLPSGFFDIAVTNFVEVGGATNRPSRFYRVRLTP